MINNSERALCESRIKRALGFVARRNFPNRPNYLFHCQGYKRHTVPARQAGGFCLYLHVFSLAVGIQVCKHPGEQYERQSVWRRQRNPCGLTTFQHIVAHSTSLAHSIIIGFKGKTLQIRATTEAKKM